jgi:hypothetical protein
VDKKMLQTQFSVRATDLAETYRNSLGRMRVGPHGYAPDMTAPDGPSTGGGVQAMQHLKLVPPQPNMPTLVVGHVNQRDGTAELRTLHYVDTMCRERFKQGAPLDPAQYSAFIAAAQGFLASCGIRVSLASPPAELSARADGTSPSTAPPTSGARTTLVVVAVVLLIGALGAAVYWLFLRK